MPWSTVNDQTFWSGPADTEPVAKPWDSTAATRAGGNNLTSSQLLTHYTPRVLNELKNLGISPETWYLSGNTNGDYDPSEVQRVGKIYQELGAKNSGGWGDVMGNAFSSPMFQMAAIPFAGQMFGGGAGNSISDLMNMNAGAGGTALGNAAATAGGGAMDWTDVLGDWPSYGADGGLSASDIQQLMDMNSGASAAPSWDLPSGVNMNDVLSTAKEYGGNIKSALSALGLDGKTLGSLLSSGLGAYASNKQTTALEDQAKRYEAYGAPYRQKLSDLYANPDSFLTSKEVQTPVQQGTNTLMRSLSTQGNPFGSGNALQQGQSYASDQLFGKLGQEKDRLAGFGGLSSYNQAAPQAATNAIQSTSNGYNAIGSGLGNIFNPPQTASQTMAEFLKTMRGP